MEEVLRLVNLARIALGMNEISELPKGIIGHPHECPIGKALGCLVRRDKAAFMDVADTCRVRRAWQTRMTSLQLITHEWIPAFELPEAFKDFVYQFDAGEWPELLEQGENSSISPFS